MMIKHHSPYIPLAAIMILTGCASQTRVEQVPVEVEVPIEVPCIDARDIPERPEIDPITKESSPGEKIEAIVIHRERLIAHSRELEGFLIGCAD